MTNPPAGARPPKGEDRRVDLLVVQRHFQAGATVFVFPDFSVPGGQWQPICEPVTIVRPDGAAFETLAQFHLSHVNLRDPAASLDERWRVTVSLPDRTGEEVPLGTRLLVSVELRDTLVPHANA